MVEHGKRVGFITRYLCYSISVLIPIGFSSDFKHVSLLFITPLAQDLDFERLLSALVLANRTIPGLRCMKMVMKIIKSL